jgi:MoaA/NifB/PqqE/SkfB family radical SAM enzyme
MKKEVYRIKKWMNNEKPGPLTIELLFGHGCNQNCKFCSMHNGKEKPLKNYKLKGILKKNNYKKIIDECNELGVERIQLSGEGEPLFNKRLTMNLMKRIKNYGIYGYLNTNGVMFSERDIKNLVKNKWDMILFSVMSPDAATHDYLVGLSGAFDKVIHNIKRFNYWKEKLKTDKPEMEIKMVLTNRNYDKIEKMVLLCQDLDLHFRLDSLIIFHEKGKKLNLNEKQKKEFKKELKKAIELSKKRNLRFNISNEILDNIYSKRTEKNEITKLQKEKNNKNKFISASCYLPWLRILINSRGFTGPCGFCYTEDNVKEKSLKNIWLGKAYNKLRQDRLNQILGKDCSICGDIEYNSIIRKELNQK